MYLQGSNMHPLVQVQDCTRYKDMQFEKVPLCDSFWTFFLRGYEFQKSLDFHFFSGTQRERLIENTKSTIKIS